MEGGWSCASGNPSVCTPVCGDGQVVGDEACDGEVFGARTCATYGFYEGELSCEACTVNTSACAMTCGDNVLQSPWEECDGPDLDGKTCLQWGCIPARWAVPLPVRLILRGAGGVVAIP